MMCECEDKKRKKKKMKRTVIGHLIVIVIGHQSSIMNFALS